ncbi:MAG: hypothetical protein RRA15_10905, partial [bacterium]|nr:hypothetical protein [bacterium]
LNPGFQLFSVSSVSSVVKNIALIATGALTQDSAFLRVLRASVVKNIALLATGALTQDSSSSQCPQ